MLGFQEGDGFPKNLPGECHIPYAKELDIDVEIGIIGLGLIGGSLGYDLRSRGHCVLGVSRRAETCDLALKRGVADQASPDFAMLTPAQVIFICTPMASIESTVRQLLPHLFPETILTDVGSVKAPIVEAIAPLWPNFVGGHPMAGTAHSGLDAAQPNLFAGRAYVFTPTAATPVAAVETVSAIAQSLGARIHLCDPIHHDQAVAWISHLPVMVSSSLIAACLREEDSTVLTLAQQLASSGFRDTSRVGGGNPELGVMMARYNRPALLRSLYTYREQLNNLISEIEQENWTSLEAKLQQTQQNRPQFGADR